MRLLFVKGGYDANVEKYISTIENSKYAEELKKIIINQ